MIPLRCCLCGQALFQRPFSTIRVCPACLRQLFRERLTERPGENRCVTCGMPLISEQGTCLQCRDTRFAFKSHRSLFMYQHTAEALIRQYKFEPLPALALLWSHCLIHLICTKQEPSTLLVPVPARRSSVRTRGWDQMRLICRHLQRRGFRTAQLLKRTGGSSQKSLNYSDRLKNLKGRIKCTLKPENPAGDPPRKVLLLDDVFTTGATLDECARILLQAGVQEIHAYTIAMTPY